MLQELESIFLDVVVSFGLCSKVQCATFIRGS